MAEPLVAFSRRYAHNTVVEASKSRMEIERTLKRFGASGFAYATMGARATLMFEARGKRIRFNLPEPKAALKPYGTWWTDKQVDAEERRLWRSLFMAIKSKLDVVESGISSFETEFLPYMELGDGRTFAEAAQDPAFAERLSASSRPSLLALGGSKTNDGAIEATFTEAK
jgi:hypothetical protein